jgi:hypothetical protein
MHSLIPPLGGNALLSLGTYDVDFSDEMEILQDGASLGYAAITADNAWSTIPERLPIPAGVSSLIEIDNSYNPPNGYIWGVRIEGLE